jgi:FlaA1/EpsC-like NDP-sugar epimerase
VQVETTIITGAGGSIGSALAEALIRRTNGHILLLDASEENLQRVERHLGGFADPIRFTTILGSVSDQKLADSLFGRYRAVRVFHTAAFKHVPLLEQNPLAALENNAIGTWKFARKARQHRTPTFVLVSTDKAVEPISVMGASKRAAEIALLCLANGSTRMAAIRLGNVWGTRGSVVPLFQAQIANGGPVTVTDPAASRYFFSLDDAVELILSVGESDSSGIFVPQVAAPRNILALAKEMIAGSPSAGPNDVPIVFTGLRRGEKQNEIFVSPGEHAERTANPRLFAVRSPIPDRNRFGRNWAELVKAVRLRETELAMGALSKIVVNYRPAR